MTEIKVPRWKDWTVFGLHWLILIGLTVAVYLWRSQSSASAGPVELTNLLIPFGVGAAAQIIFVVLMFMRSLAMAAPAVMTVGDWVITGVYIHLVQADPIFTLAIGALLIVPGMLRLGIMWGSIHAVGIIAIVLGLIVMLSGVDQMDDLGSLLPVYLVPVLTLILIALSIGAWVYARDEYDATAMLNKMVNARAKQLDDMHQRARTVSEMTSALIGTKNPERILEVTLNIGELSLRKHARIRLVGLVMLFRASDDMLYVANTRGLRYVDPNRVIPGKAGIIGQALQDCTPIIGTNPSNDPELARLGIFKGIRSVLVIPMRAHYDNYGVLIFASEEYNAFNEDHIDTLYSITVQATVALQNAVLYNNLMQEKDRIIEMEEDARKALVRDLHDIPTQTISAVAMRLSIARRMIERDPAGLPTELESIEQLTRETIEQIRHVLFTLRPLALEDQGLTAALHQLAEKVYKTHGQAVTMKVAPDIENYLDEKQQGALFYFIEEAVNNARKYAQAPLISVQVARHAGMLAVRIADNGRGFDVDQAAQNEKGSFGLINMRERIGLLDGTLTLDSSVGKGTVITALVPLDNEARRAIKDNNGRKRAQTQMERTKLAVSAQRQMEKL